ncbi:hypothetical protein D3C80_486530 [compost metagenome]
MRERFSDIVTIARKIYNQLKFARSREHMIYALALEQTGDIAKADKEFKMMNGSFSYYEHRYQYGLFLERNEKIEEARLLFEEITEEETHLSAQERRMNRKWFNLVKEQLKVTA